MSYIYILSVLFQSSDNGGKQNCAFCALVILFRVYCIYSWPFSFIKLPGENII